jgi:hypothetical protein
MLTKHIFLYVSRSKLVRFIRLHSLVLDVTTTYSDVAA